MEKSLLIEALEQLDKKERRQFARFVRSPFFNLREDVIQLYDFLADCLWEHRVVPSKEQAFRRLYGDEPFDDHKARVAMSILLKLLERFFEYLIFTEDGASSRAALIQAYRQRQLPRHFRRSLKSAKSQLEANSRRDAAHHRASFKLKLEEYEFLASRKRASAFNLGEIGREFDRYYFSSKLRQACLALSHQAVYPTEYEFGFLTELIRHIDERAGDWLEVPAIAIYYHCYHALARPEEEAHFERFLALLFTRGQLFSRKELQDLYLLAINFCTRRYNEGDSRYLKSQLELYRQGLKKEIFLREGQLSRFTYRNIVTLGLILEEYDWVEQFLWDYKPFLEEQEREGMFNFCLARLEYSRQEYGRALQLLQQSEYRDPLLHLSAKAVIIKIFYELEEIGPLEAQMDALQAFLRRKKALGYHRENYSNMLKYLRKLLELRTYGKKERETLRREIGAEKALAERAWLLEAVGSWRY